MVQVAVREEQEGRAMNQYSCKGCGTELTALNMSDDEKYCQTCFNKIVVGLDTEDESIETKWMPDYLLDVLITSPCPQAHEGLPHIQRMKHFKGY